MNQSQSKAEIRAIQTELQTIRANQQADRSQRPLPSLPNLPNTVTSTRQTVLSQAMSRPVAPPPQRPIDRPPATARPATRLVEPRSAPGPAESKAVETKLVVPLHPTSTVSQQLKQLQFTPQAANPASIALQQLETQADQINQLANTQEAALQEFKRLAEQVQQEWKTAEQESLSLNGVDLNEVDLNLPPVCEYESTGVPQVEKTDDGVFVLSLRSIDLLQAEREAALTAEALRHRAQHYSPRRRSFWSRWGLGQPSREPARRSRRRPSRPPSITLRQGMSWLIGAAVVRIALNLLLVSYPGLWVPVMGIILTPAAIAVYRSITPQSTLVWGIRLLLVMIGFLLGGRLG